MQESDNTLLPFAIKAAWNYKGSVMFIALCVATFSYILSSVFNDQPPRAVIWDTFRLASEEAPADLKRRVEEFAASSGYTKYHHLDPSPIDKKVNGFIFVYRPNGNSRVVAWMESRNHLAAFQHRMSTAVAKLEGGRTIRTTFITQLPMPASVCIAFGVLAGLLYAMAAQGLRRFSARSTSAA